MAIADQELSLLNDVAETHNDDVLEADQVLREIVQAGRRPTHPELTFLQRNVGWDEKRVNQELRRMNNVMRLAAIAGTPEDRAAAHSEAITASEVLATEGEKLANTIAKAQAKLSALERDDRISRKRVDDQTAAVHQLRELAPAHIRDRFNVEKRELKSTLGKQIADTMIRYNELDCCLTPSKYPSERDYLDMLHRSCRDGVSIIDERGMRKLRLSEQWPTIRADLQREFNALHATIEELQSQFDAKLASLESQLDYYATGTHDAD